MPLLRALLTAAHSRLSALMVINGAPPALDGAPSARRPHSESLLKPPDDVGDRDVGLSFVRAAHADEVEELSLIHI